MPLTIFCPLREIRFHGTDPSPVVQRILAEAEVGRNVAVEGKVLQPGRLRAV
jgi:hypothetical protein